MNTTKEQRLSLIVYFSIIKFRHTHVNINKFTMITIEFKGHIKQFLKFKIHDIDIINPTIENGDLYIGGTRIISVTPNSYKYVIEKVRRAVFTLGELIVLEFSVDSDGNCVCSKFYSGNRIDFLISRIMGC